jgi:putative endonuclease
VAVKGLPGVQGPGRDHHPGYKKIISPPLKIKSRWWHWRDTLSQKGEKQACRFLQAQGYKILTRRYTTRYGEIDIIARRSTTLSFIEVKTRQGLRSSDPLEAITFRKWQSLQRAASIYLQKFGRNYSDLKIEFLGIGIRIEGERIKIECLPLFFD